MKICKMKTVNVMQDVWWSIVKHLRRPWNDCWKHRKGSEENWTIIAEF